MDRLKQFLPYVCLAMVSCAACLLWLDSRRANDHTMETIASDPAPPPATAKSPLTTSTNHDLLLADLNAVLTVSQTNARSAETDLAATMAAPPPSVSAPPVYSPQAQNLKDNQQMVEGINSGSPIAFAPSADDRQDLIGLTSMNHDRATQSVLEASHAAPTIFSRTSEIAIQVKANVALPPSVAPSLTDHIQYGQSLARRGAFHSARTEFVQALMVLAQSLDGQEKTQQRAQALGRGLTALQESQDFIVNRDGQSMLRSVAEIAAGHSTKVDLTEAGATLPHQGAFHRYVVYAVEQLRLASGQSPLAADVFHSLGKLISLMSDHGEAPALMARTQAMAMHRLAVECNPQHYSSANELGVLLAWHGDLERAKQMLLQSLRTVPQPEAWHNLAEVHTRLGEHELAERARFESQLMRQQAEPLAKGAGEPWVDERQFGAMGSDHQFFEVAAPTANQDSKPRSSTANSNSFSWPQQQRVR